MKTAFVCFSLTGNLLFVARRVEDALGADVIHLEPVNPYPASGAKKFLMGGKSAVFGEAPQLKPCAFDASAYDLIILGTPVWAGTFAPPLRTFVRENKAALAGKRLAAVACSSGGSAEKALNRLAEELGLAFTDSSTWQIAMGADGVHFSPRGHAIYAAKMAQRILALGI